MDRLRIGWAGLGPRGCDLIANALWVPEARVAAICDKDPAALERARSWLERNGRDQAPAFFTSYESMLGSDLDAVVVATEISLHAPMSIQALEAGKHVFSEVPAITSERDATLLRAAVRASGRLFMLGENACYWAFIDEWRSMYREGRLGRAWYAEAEYLHNVVSLMRDSSGRPTWRSRMNAIQYLTHDLGPLLYILDDRCISASGFAPAYNPISEHSSGTPNEVGMFRTEKGALIKVLTAFGIEREPAGHNYCLYGSRGSLETTRDGSYQTHACFVTAEGKVDAAMLPTGLSPAGVPEQLLALHGGADYMMVRDFVLSAQHGTPARVGIDLAIAMSLPGIYAHRSLERGGNPVDIVEASDA